jgi:hypothetical protein
VSSPSRSVYNTAACAARHNKQRGSRTCSVRYCWRCWLASRSA